MLVAATTPAAFAAALDAVQSAGTGCTIAAAGDIASSNGRQEGTARLVETINPTAVLTLGDEAYEDGSAEQFAEYYEPTWGRFKDKTHATPGNHEYNTSGAKGYYEYFNQSEPYYAVDVCGWRLLSLNSEEDTAAQVTFVEKEAAAATGKPMLAIWHQPRYSNDTDHGDNSSMQPLWDAVTQAGVKIVLNGHSHDYERFAPMDASGTKTESGTRQWVVGTGGADNYQFGGKNNNSEKQITNTTGVLALSLKSNGYDYAFHEVSGSVTDKGTASFTPVAAISPEETEPAQSTDEGDTTASSTGSDPTVIDPGMQEPPAVVEPTSPVDAVDPPEPAASGVDPDTPVSNTTVAVPSKSEGLNVESVNDEAVVVWAADLTGVANVDVKFTFGTETTSQSIPVDSFNRFSATELVPAGFTGQAEVLVTAGDQQLAGSVAIGGGGSGGATDPRITGPTEVMPDPSSTDPTEVAADPTEVAPVDEPSPVPSGTTPTFSGSPADVKEAVKQLQAAIVTILTALVKMLSGLFG